MPDEISHSYQMMIFWAGLRGAVGVALAMGFSGEAKWTLLATVLVVVVLTVILFGGTTASMLEILGIKIGCVDESGDFLDDEFDIEAPPRFHNNCNNLIFLQWPTKSKYLRNRRFARSSKLSNYKDNLSAVNLLDQEHGGVPNTGNSSTSNFANVNDDDDDDEIVGSDVDDFIRIYIQQY